MVSVTGKGRIFARPKTARHACEALGLMFEERGFLAEQGVDWRLYDRYELD